MCLSGGALLKAGANVSTTLSTTGGDDVDTFINEAESYINAVCRYNYTDAYAGLNDDVKKLLEEVSSNLAAMYCLQYDMSGYTSRAEAQTMLDVLYQRVQDGIKILKEKPKQTFINKA